MSKTFDGEIEFYVRPKDGQIGIRKASGKSENTFTDETAEAALKFAEEAAAKRKTTLHASVTYRPVDPKTGKPAKGEMVCKILRNRWGAPYIGILPVNASVTNKKSAEVL